MNTHSVISNSPCELLKIQQTQIIQGCGIFISIDTHDFIIKFISENCEFYFLQCANEMIGLKADNLFSQTSILLLKSFINQVHNMDYKPRSVIYLESVFSRIPNKIKPCLVYVSENTLCIEFEAKDHLSSFDTQILELDNLNQELLHSSLDKNNLCQWFCISLHKIIPFGRVYYCEFEDDGHGVVLGESNELQSYSLLHHHFPASDVPMVVRQLYTRTRYRMIGDCQSTPVPIIGLKHEFDLSQSLYRSMGKSHLVYLKNMGLRASASFSVIIQNQLDGLLGFHSEVPKIIPLELMPKINRIISTFSLKLLSIKYTEQKKSNNTRELEIIDFMEAFQKSSCEIQNVPKSVFQEIKYKLKAQNFFFGKEENIECEQELPEELKRIIFKWIKSKLKGKQIYVTESLSQDFPEFKLWENYVSGILILFLEEDAGSYLAFTRPEKIQTLSWAGEPNTFDIKKDGTLNPRHSFSTWYEEIKGKSVKWNKEELRYFEDLRLKMLIVRSNYLSQVSEVNKKLTEKNVQIQTLLSEVHHRVKNNLAIVSSLFDWKIKELTSQDMVDDFKEMKSRIRTISFLHESLYQGNGFSHVNLSKYISGIFRETYSLLSQRVQITFNNKIESEVVLPLSMALPMGLITQEFITNSIKYAFPNSINGNILVEWKVVESRTQFILKDNGIGCHDIDHIIGSSLGLKLIKLLIKQIDAIAYWDGSDNGVTLTIQFAKEIKGET